MLAHNVRDLLEYVSPSLRYLVMSGLVGDIGELTLGLPSDPAFETSYMYYKL